MDMSGEYRIAAPRERVWAALNDPDTLRQAIPGCEELNKVSETELEAVARAKIGPVSARFKGKVTLSELKPPESYILTGEGSGGAAGFAKGQAQVSLVADGDETILHYSVKATIGGKLAQLGQRLVDGAAKKMADEFFENFASLAGGKVQAKSAPAPSMQPANDNRINRLYEPPTWLPGAIIGGAIAILLFVLLR